MQLHQKKQRTSQSIAICCVKPRQDQQSTLPLSCRYPKQPSERTGNSHRNPFGQTLRLWWRSHAGTHARNQLCRPGVFTVNPANFRSARKASQKPCWFHLTFQRPDCWSSGGSIRIGKNLASTHLFENFPDQRTCGNRVIQSNVLSDGVQFLKGGLRPDCFGHLLIFALSSLWL